jgi:hypothetical protein
MPRRSAEPMESRRLEWESGNPGIHGHELLEARMIWRLARREVALS